MRNEKPHSTQINFECMPVTFESGFWNWTHTPGKTDITHLKHNIDVQCFKSVTFDSMNISVVCVNSPILYHFLGSSGTIIHISISVKMAVICQL